MRSSLRWTLAAAAGAALAANWLPDDGADAVVPAMARSSAAGQNGSPPLPPVAQAQGQGQGQAQDALPRAAPAPVTTRTETASPADMATASEPRTDWPALSGAVRSAWVPRPAPPPPAPPAAAASTPAPPPAFPYQWLGQLEDDGQTRIFIANPQRVWAVVPGEVLEQRWRIDGVDAGRLQLTWLATGATVMLAARP